MAETTAGILIFGSVLVFLWAVLGLISPGVARIPNRIVTFWIWLLSVLIFIAGGALLPEPEPEIDRGAWRTASQEDPLTERIIHVATLEATNQTRGHIFRVTPTLVVRCRARSFNSTTIYINWENYLDGNSGNFQDNRHIVTLRIGDGRPFTVRANVSNDNEATFLPIATVLNPIANADTLVARTTPFNESPQTAVFDLKGPREALSDLAAACNWNSDPRTNRKLEQIGN